jgi:hypothetical protein
MDHEKKHWSEWLGNFLVLAFILLSGYMVEPGKSALSAKTWLLTGPIFVCGLWLTFKGEQRRRVMKSQKDLEVSHREAVDLDRLQEEYPPGPNCLRHLIQIGFANVAAYVDALHKENPERAKLIDDNVKLSESLHKSMQLVVLYRKEIDRQAQIIKTMERMKPGMWGTSRVPQKRGPLLPMEIVDSAQCPSCRQKFKVGEIVTDVVLGPGNDLVQQAKCRKGESYVGQTIQVHWSCYTGEPDVPEAEMVANHSPEQV